MAGKLNSDFYGYDRLVREILVLGKEGISKKTIIDKLSLSEQQIRRITADLVNRGLLIYQDALRSYITTAKGILYVGEKIDGTYKILVAIDGSESSMRATSYQGS